MNNIEEHKMTEATKELGKKYDIEIYYSEYFNSYLIVRDNIYWKVGCVDSRYEIYGFICDSLEEVIKKFIEEKLD